MPNKKKEKMDSTLTNPIDLLKGLFGIKKIAKIFANCDNSLCSKKDAERIVRENAIAAGYKLDWALAQGGILQLWNYNELTGIYYSYSKKHSNHN